MVQKKVQKNSVRYVVSLDKNLRSQVLVQRNQAPVLANSALILNCSI